MKTATGNPSRTSVPSGKGSKVEMAITINAPVAQVYQFWRQLENLPRFMRHLESVTQKDSNHSHWSVRTPRDKLVHWDAELIEERENEMLSWRSLPGADVDNAGSVWFTPAPGGRGTMLKVALKYSPPAGKLGMMLAKLWGRDAEAEIKEDLYRLKSLLETGETPTTEGQPRGSKGGRA